MTKKSPTSGHGISSSDPAVLSTFKVAFKGATMAFVAGAHQAVQSALSQGFEAPEEDAPGFLDQIFDDPSSWEILAHGLNQDTSYPLDGTWAADELAEIGSLVRPPALNQDDAYDFDSEIRFRKGFNETLLRIATTYAAKTDEEDAPASSDHWLVTILNNAFQFGAQAALAASDQDEHIEAALAEIDSEPESWSRYEQLTGLLDRELGRSYDASEASEGRGGSGEDDADTISLHDLDDGDGDGDDDDDDRFN